MNIFRWLRAIILIFGITVSFITCTKRVEALTDFDEAVWKQDRHACQNRRGSMVQSILSQRDKLLGLDELEIVAVLGKPDQHEIYKRSEKFHYFNVTPSKECADTVVSVRRLVIRFNAMGLAKEISLE
jgi:hypothetical protein